MRIQGIKSKTLQYMCPYLASEKEMGISTSPPPIQRCIQIEEIVFHFLTRLVSSLFLYKANSWGRA